MSWLNNIDVGDEIEFTQGRRKHTAIVTSKGINSFSSNEASTGIKHTWHKSAYEYEKVKVIKKKNVFNYLS